jgi:Mn-containing catalase
VACCQLSMKKARLPCKSAKQSPEQFIARSEHREDKARRAPALELDSVKRCGLTYVSGMGSWNTDFVTTTGNVILDLLHTFHLECGARLHKLRVYETLTDPTGREVCGCLLVRACAPTPMHWL